MIKKEIIKFYYLDYRSKKLILKDKEVKVFNKSGNCIEIYKYSTIDKAPDLRPFETTLKYDNNNNLVNKIEWTPLMLFWEEEYENKYDKIGNLIGYNMKATSGSIGDFSEHYPTKGTFNYDEENRLIKSEIVSHNKNKYGTEESINIAYDDSGEIIKKDRFEILNIKHDDQYRHTEEKHRFHYNDQGQRLTEIKFYQKNKIDDELLFNSKVIISEDEKLFYDQNDNINKRIKFFYDDEGRIMKEEECVGNALNDIQSMLLYEYEID